MRGAARWLLLLAIFGILGWIWVTYQVRRRAIEDQAPRKPDMLPLEIAGKAEDWHHVESDGKGGRNHIRVSQVSCYHNNLMKANRRPTL